MNTKTIFTVFVLMNTACGSKPNVDFTNPNAATPIAEAPRSIVIFPSETLEQESSDSGSKAINEHHGDDFNVRVHLPEVFIESDVESDVESLAESTITTTVNPTGETIVSHFPIPISSGVTEIIPEPNPDKALLLESYREPQRVTFIVTPSAQETEIAQNYSEVPPRKDEHISIDPAKPESCEMKFKLQLKIVRSNGKFIGLKKHSRSIDGFDIEINSDPFSIEQNVREETLRFQVASSTELQQNLTSKKSLHFKDTIEFEDDEWLFVERNQNEKSNDSKFYSDQHGTLYKIETKTHKCKRFISIKQFVNKK